MATNADIAAGDVLIDTVNKRTYKVTRRIGNNLVEIQYIDSFITTKYIQNADEIIRGIAAGRIKRTI